MSRHLAKLQTLIAKLEARYGADDRAVLELREQLETLAALEAEGAALRAQRLSESDRPAADLL